MALSFEWYSNKHIAEKEIFDFVVSVGGEIQTLNDSLSQCIVKQNDAYIHVISNDYFLSELEDKDYKELRKCGVSPKSSVTIPIGLNDKGKRSVMLAKWFCEKLLSQYPESVIVAFDKCYTVSIANEIPDNWEQ